MPLIYETKAKDDGGIADPGTPVGSGTDPAWDPMFEKPIHGVINITGESKVTITVRLAEIEILLLDTIHILGKLDGNVRPGNQAGHEHFGFKDGISQPPVIGFKDPNQGRGSHKARDLEEDGDFCIGKRPS